MVGFTAYLFYPSSTVLYCTVLALCGCVNNSVKDSQHNSKGRETISTIFQDKVKTLRLAKLVPETCYVDLQKCQ